MSCLGLRSFAVSNSIHHLNYALDKMSKIIFKDSSRQTLMFVNTLLAPLTLWAVCFKNKKSVVFPIDTPLVLRLVKTQMGKCLFSPELKSYLITQ